MTDEPGRPRSDAEQAVRFMLAKAAIFILVPLAAAAAAVMFTLK